MNYTLQEFEKWLAEEWGQTGCLDCVYSEFARKEDEEWLKRRFGKEWEDDADRFGREVDTIGWEQGNIHSRLLVRRMLQYRLTERVLMLGIHPADLAERVRDLRYTPQFGLIANNCVTKDEVLKGLKELIQDHDLLLG